MDCIPPEVPAPVGMPADVKPEVTVLISIKPRSKRRESGIILIKLLALTNPMFRYYAVRASVTGSFWVLWFLT